MAKLLYNFVILLCFHYACAQRDVDRSYDASPEKIPDTVSKFLSELGDFMLDVDERFSKQMAPKVELENSIKEQYGRTRTSRTDYFDRIRDNYRTLQRRISSLGIPGDLSISSELFEKIGGQASVVDVSIPSLPMQLRVRSNNALLKEPKNSEELSERNNGESTTTDPNQIHSSESNFASKIKVGSAEIKIGSKLIDNKSPDSSTKSEKGKPQQSSQRFKLAVKFSESSPKLVKSEKSIPDGSEADLSDSFSKGFGKFSSRSEDHKVEENMESGVTGRILGDILYSESMFDKLTRRVLRDHGKWILDSDFLPSKIFDRLDEVTQLVLRRNEPADKIDTKKDALKITKINQDIEVRNPEDMEQEKDSKSSIQKTNSIKPMNYDLTESEISRNEEKEDSALQTKFTKDNKNIQTETDRREHSDTIILAFTQDGIPLKLRMGKEIDNPLKFLHNILKTAQVYLNVPVKSHDDITPTGKEILQLGSGNDDMATKALFIDLSDSNQRSSLLKTLRKFRTQSNGI